MNTRTLRRRQLLAWRKARQKLGLPPGLILTHNTQGQVFIEGSAEPLPDVVAEPLPDGGVRYVLYR